MGLLVRVKCEVGGLVVPDERRWQAATRGQVAECNMVGIGGEEGRGGVRRRSRKEASWRGFPNKNIVLVAEDAKQSKKKRERRKLKFDSRGSIFNACFDPAFEM